MDESLLSVGIDLGTTTTQIIFSSFQVQNIASAFSVPRVKILDKKIIYRSGIYFTPLINRNTIDVQKVREIIESEYKKAGISPKDVKAGAVIITGETARKENSEAVTKTMTGLAGDFVVATAGSDLESILAGRGCGAAEMSKKLLNKSIASVDIGGGTTNICVFKDGNPLDTTCLDIGGRQIIIEPQTLKLIYVAKKTAALAVKMGISLIEGRESSVRDLETICMRFADIIAESLELAKKTQDLELFYTAHPLKSSWDLDSLVFSGGVADFIYKDYNEKNLFPYGDIGVLLGKAIQKNPSLNSVKKLMPKETIRATVVGAGANSMDISGSTIAWSNSAVLPIQNIPIVKMTDDDEAQDYRFFAKRISEKLEWFKDENGAFSQVAIGFKGIHNPSFDFVKDIGKKILEGLAKYLETNNIIILIIDNDMAKSLGYSLMNALPNKKFIVIDNIVVENGDYIDIGVPLSQGRVIPVVVKTLIFGK
ncbi:MAG: ethanolamine ammonia-lyase reactivating factor EutA [Elusimicrobiota bacterium]|jgi:ethanolamine utilization protein EutA|nr:ethanolamine ammonia-lyase reactivating factor EutA [Elusimicrobiota bacterium]